MFSTVPPKIFVFAVAPLLCIGTCPLEVILPVDISNVPVLYIVGA